MGAVSAGEHVLGVLPGCRARATIDD
jgi:hypothetical protein